MGNFSVYKCPDGTDFPVTWPQPEDADKKWEWEQEHAPDPLKPLEVSLGPLVRPGTQRAFAEAEVPTPALFRSSIVANGYVYLPTSQLPPDEQQELLSAAERLAAREGGIWEVWERYCLPRIQTACESIVRDQGVTPIATVAEVYGYSVRLTHVAGSFSLFAPVIKKFIDYADELGLDGQQLFADITPGNANSTLQSNAALWRLAAVADRSPSVRAVLFDLDPAGAWEAIRVLPDGGEFVAAFSAYLHEYGCRTGSWGLGYPTWQEDPSSPLRLVRRIMEARPPTPEQSLREGARRREAVWRGVEGRLVGQDGSLHKLRRLAAPLVHYIPIREARAQWQLALSGALRTLLVRRARPLVERGMLADLEDVFYLTVDEMHRALKGDSAATSALEKRRSEWTFWSQRRPPSTIGSVADSNSFPQAAPADRDVIRGLAASRGVVTGRARVVEDISDAGGLISGEVLVCAMSSPPWTPLFAIAAAVVTDSGGILSHPAIVAREYGIPCVVGTRTATATIRNGDLVTVDGKHGTVRIESAAK